MNATNAATAAAKATVISLSLPKYLNFFIFGFDLSDIDASNYPSKSHDRSKTPSKSHPALEMSEIGRRINTWVATRPVRFKDFTIEDLMEKTHLDRRHIRSYMRHKNTSFRQWKVDLRINEVKNLLLENRDSSIEEIAKSSGFTDKSNFFRRFREIVGETPKKWKDNYL